MTNDEIIDEVIKALYPHKDIALHDILYKVIPPSTFNDNGSKFVEIRDRINELLIDNNIIKVQERGYINIELSSYGKTIFENGGWVKIIKNNNELQKLKNENESFQKQIQKTNTKINFGLLIVGVISIIFLGYGIHQADKTNKLENKLEVATKEKDSLYSVTVDQYMHLKTREKEMIKLKQSIDSLLNKLKVDSTTKKK